MRSVQLSKLRIKALEMLVAKGCGQRVKASSQHRMQAPIQGRGIFVLEAAALAVGARGDGCRAVLPLGLGLGRAQVDYVPHRLPWRAPLRPM